MGCGGSNVISADIIIIIIGHGGPGAADTSWALLRCLLAVQSPRVFAKRPEGRGAVGRRDYALRAAARGAGWAQIVDRLLVVWWRRGLQPSSQHHNTALLDRNHIRSIRCPSQSWVRPQAWSCLNTCVKWAANCQPATETASATWQFNLCRRAAEQQVHDAPMLSSNFRYVPRSADFAWHSIWPEVHLGW